MKQYTFRTIIEPDDPKGYHAYVPILPGVHTSGRNIKEVKKNIKEAIKCHIEGLIKDGEKVPKEEEVMEAYRQFYGQSPFIRVLPAAAATGSMDVRGTNYCNLVVSTDERTGRLRVVSYIDNLMKGQAGSALQNMNLLFGMEETLGLNRSGIYP